MIEVKCLLNDKVAYFKEDTDFYLCTETKFMRFQENGDRINETIYSIIINNCTVDISKDDFNKFKEKI